MNELAHLEMLVSHGKMTRREFLAKASALGLTALAIASLPDVSAGAASPKPGGRFRVGMSDASTADSLDPVRLPSQMPIFITFGQLANCLVELDFNGKVVPELSETWEPSSDAKRWVFTLRRGVEFHNGKTVDADDVIFSFNRHRGKDSISGAKPLLEQVSDIRADGKQSVIFTLKKGNIDFPYFLTDYHLVIIPGGTTDFDNGIGTGAYRLDSFEPGVRCLTRRNPNYWKAGRAHFDEVETIHIPDVSARVNALKSGVIDYMERCDYRTAHLLERLPGVQLLNTPGRWHVTMPMLTDSPPYDDNNVRLAMKYCTDRRQMVKQILQGYGAPGNDHPIARDMRFFNPNLKQRVYDPDKARFYIKKAGLEGHTFKLHAADIVFPGAIDSAVLFKEQAAKAGIQIEVVREPSDGYWQNVWIKKPLCVSYWLSRPIEDMLLSTVYGEGSSWNESRFKHTRFNILLNKARTELDRNTRREMYAEMQQILHDEGGAIVPFFMNILEAATDKVQVEKVSAHMILDGMKIAERAWFGS